MIRKDYNQMLGCSVQLNYIQADAKNEPLITGSQKIFDNVTHGRVELTHRQFNTSAYRSLSAFKTQELKDILNQWPMLRCDN